MLRFSKARLSSPRLQPPSLSRPKFSQRASFKVRRLRSRTREGKTSLEVVQMSANHNFPRTPFSQNARATLPAFLNDHLGEIKGCTTSLLGAMTTYFRRVVQAKVILLPTAPSLYLLEMAVAASIETTEMRGGGKTVHHLLVARMSSCQTSRTTPLLLFSQPKTKAKTPTLRPVVSPAKAGTVAMQRYASADGIDLCS